MVQLRSYFSLCALTAPRGALGVSVDARPGVCLLTLSKNVVMRYQFSDQKQISGWTSRDSLTAPVVFDTNEDSYVGVFNENILKLWEENTKALDKLKKIKLGRSIFKLVKDDEGKTVLVFKDGSCASLTYSIYAKKNLEAATFLNENETIIDAAVFEYDEYKYLCLITKLKDVYSVIIGDLNLDIDTLMIETVKRVEIKRQEFPKGKVIGLCLSSNVEAPQVFVLWSDGRLFSLKLRQFVQDSGDIEDQAFKLTGQVPWLSFDVEVNMVWMGENHLALYGADVAQEGAVLVVFNVVLGEGACRYPLKFFSLGARVWCLPETLVLEANQHIAVLPFSLSSHRNMLSLLGSNKKNVMLEGITIADWGEGGIPLKSDDIWSDLIKNGVPERDIISQYLPTLLENDDIAGVKKSFKKFKDIPENLIVSMLSYVVKKVRLEMTTDSTDCLTVFRKNSKLKSLLYMILDLSYIDNIIVPYLKNKLDIDDMIILLKYINYFLIDTCSETNGSIKTEAKIIKWGSVLIDSHFQELLLLKDKEKFEAVAALKCTLDELIENVNYVGSVLPIIESMCYEKVDNKDENVLYRSALYYIEDVKLF